ncbi:MAG: tyrosine-type recombinase/integrase [Desulfobacterales bacterium]
MAKEWIKTSFPGVRYRKHPSRKHGKKFDQYFSIRYKLAGRDKEEGVGWASHGHTATSAHAALAELKHNQRLGTGPQTLAEKRQLEEEEKKAAEQEKEAEAIRNITWAEVWEKYLEHSEATKSKNSVRTEKILAAWIGKGVSESTPICSVSPFHLEKIRSAMTKAGKSARTIQYALGTVRAVINYAKRNDLFDGDNPVGKIRMPSFDNRKMRFLTHDEASLLLEKLAGTSLDVHDKALLSLHAGLRLGEINSLTWADTDLERGLLTLRNTKNGKTRAAFLTDQAKAMLKARRQEDANPTDLVFPARGGEKSYWTSATFARTVKAMGLNEGITDRRQKVTFHTLRHSFASWLVENGTDLFVVKELLGHSDFRMTSRYSHLGQNTLQSAVGSLGKSLPVGTAGGKVISMRRKRAKAG